ncbi:MAG: mannose-6-phosphate isomerase, class I [Spirochaetaceae bacterium]
MVLRLKNQLKAYDWGDRVAIPRFLGLKPSDGPVAEMWMGAHPAGSSVVETAEGREVPLVELIAAQPAETLGRMSGSAVHELPFLFKLLAAERALSIQVHPSREQAAVGYAWENSRGIALDARERTYKDSNHKPELIRAAGPFWAMSGFRDPYDSLPLIRAAGITAADTRGVLREVLAMSSAEVTAAHSRLSLPPVDPEELYRDHGELTDEIRLAWVRELQQQYGPDPGTLAPLFLNIVRLDTGEALFQGAGLVHAYLRGFGFEVMANCDNVLRAGLTSKYMNVNELLDIVNFDSAPPARVVPRETGPGVEEYVCPVPDFRLLQARVAEGPREITTGGCPAIVLCVEGSVTAGGAEALTLKRGESAFIGGAHEGFTLAPASSGTPARALVATCSAPSFP